MFYWKLTGVGVCIALMTGCGPSESGVNGVFLDGAVEGLTYSANGRVGTTSATGAYTCYPGETVQFSIGGISLGQANCAATLTPLNLAGSAEMVADPVVNRLVVLQALDEDDNPANGIRITSTVSKALASATLNFALAPEPFHAALTAVLPNATDAFGKSYKARTMGTNRRQLAIEHFSGTLAAIGGTSSGVRSVQSASAGGNVQITSYSLMAADSMHVPYAGTNARIRADFPKGFYPAVGSGLAFKGVAADGTLEFWGVTDRGPNGDGPAVNQTINGAVYTASKVFPAPGFVPSLAVISVGKQGAVLGAMLPLSASTTQKMDGRPLAKGVTGSSGELPLNEKLVYDSANGLIANGIDTESVVVDTARNALWISDEYGPFIAKVDPATGIILKKYEPGTAPGNLPAVLLKRRANRGMEGLAIDAASGRLHGFLQSPIDDGKVTDTLDLDRDGKTSTDTVNVRDYAQLVRWIEFDPTTETSRAFAYPVHFPVAGQSWDRNRSGSVKLGDLTHIGGGKFVVIEQGADANAVVRNFLMLVEIPANVTNIGALGSELEKNSIDTATASAIAWKDVVPLKKTLLLDLNAAGWLAEKAEGLARVDEQTLALINDNDFGVRTVVLDANGTELAGSVEDCTASAGGVLSGCMAGAASAVVTRGVDTERPTRIWLLRFPKALASYTVP